MIRIVYDTSTGIVENIISCDMDFTLTGKTLVTYEGQAEVGYTWNGSTFDAPPAYVNTWTDVNNLQNKLLGVGTEALWRVGRYKEQMEMTIPVTTETPASYQLLLDYRQLIRDNDETTHATPDLALAALNAQATPTAILN